MAIGVAGDFPFVHLNGANGKSRASLMLNTDQKPYLLMEDEEGLGLLLGNEASDLPSPDDDNLGLYFSPDILRMGVGVVREGGKRYAKSHLVIREHRHALD
jgi:hypothetical protein